MKNFRWLMILMLVSSGCYNANDYLLSNIKTGEVLQKVYASKNSIPADGASSATITVELPLETAPALSKVTFSTTAGTFKNKSDTISMIAQFSVDSSKNKLTAQVQLTSSLKTDTATVTCSIEPFVKKMTVIFTEAQPQKLKLSISSLSINTGYDQNVTITTSLIRIPGIPSLGTISDLTVKDAGNQTIGYFVNYSNQSDSSGTTRNKFTLGKLPYSGKLTAVASSVLLNQQILKDSIIFNAN